MRDIRVQSAVKGTLTLVMAPGAMSEQVVVRADATTLRIGNSTVGEVFESDTLLTLPVSERDALQFAYHAPGMAPPAPGSRLSTQGNIGLNSSGAREASNNFLLDGVDNNDLFLNRLVVNPSLDAIEEVSLQQNTYDAEYGRSAGAQVNMVLKSGTRSLHGSAYEFFRHSALDARNQFEPTDQPQTELRKHQFGGTIGRTDRPLAVVLLRQCRSHRRARSRHPSRARAHGPGADRRLQPERCDRARSVHGPAVPGERHSAGAYERGRALDPRALPDAQSRKRPGQPRFLADGRA